LISDVYNQTAQKQFITTNKGLLGKSQLNNECINNHSTSVLPLESLHQHSHTHTHLSTTDAIKSQELDSLVK